MDEPKERGWYATSSGSVRYWDGTAYTFTTSPKDLKRHAAQGTQVADVDFTAPVHVPPRPQWQERAALTAIVLTLVGLVIVGVALPLGVALVCGAVIAVAGWCAMRFLLDGQVGGIGSELVAVVVGGLVIAGAAGFITGVVRPDATSGPDATARLACTHFRNVLDDVTAGVLTGEELRSKAAEVHADASASTWPGLADAASAFLAAATSGGDTVGTASRLADVCAQVPNL